MAMAELPGPYDVQAYDCVVARRRHPHLPDGALSRRFAPGDHLRARTADGQGGRPVRHRSDRNPPSQSDRPLSLQVGHRPDVRRSQLSSDPGDGGRAHRPAGVPRAPEAGPGRGPLSRHRLCDVFRTHRLRQPGVCGARHGDHAGLGERRDHHGPIGPGRGAHRLVAARAGAAHHAGPDHRRRDRRRAAADQGHPWRYRPHALWLGHLRQPLAGDRRRREPDRGAEAADQAAQDREPHARGLGRRYRARRRHGQGQRHRPLDADRDHGAPGLLPDPSLQRRDRARPDRDRQPTIRPAPSPTPATSRSSRSTSRPVTWRSRNSWWPRMPAASSIR